MLTLRRLPLTLGGRMSEGMLMLSISRLLKLRLADILRVISTTAALAVAAAGSSVSASDFPAVIPLSSLDGSNGFRLDGIGSSASTGASVANAGDVNGDGIADVIIGASLASPN